MCDIALGDDDLVNIVSFDKRIQIVEAANIFEMFKDQLSCREFVIYKTDDIKTVSDRRSSISAATIFAVRSPPTISTFRRMIFFCDASENIGLKTSVRNSVIATRLIPTNIANTSRDSTKSSLLITNVIKIKPSKP